MCLSVSVPLTRNILESGNRTPPVPICAAPPGSPFSVRSLPSQLKRNELRRVQRFKVKSLVCSFR